MFFFIHTTDRTFCLSHDFACDFQGFYLRAQRELEVRVTCFEKLWSRSVDSTGLLVKISKMVAPVNAKRQTQSGDIPRRTSQLDLM